MEKLYSLMINEETGKHHIFEAKKKGSVVEPDEASYCGKAYSADLKVFKSGLDEKGTTAEINKIDEDDLCQNCFKSYDAD